MNSLAGSRAKISRANEQIDMLRQQLCSAMNSDANKLLVDIKNDVFDGEPSITIFVTQVPIFSLEISILIGEIVHNLRSSLDHLAWSLVPQNQLNRMNVVSRRRIAFPLAQNRKSFWSQINQRIPSASVAQCKIIEQYQPYRRTSAGQMMRALRTLSDTDKHRFVVPALFVPSEFHAKVEARGAKRVDHILRLAPGREIKLGTRLNTWTLTAVPKNVSMDYKITCFPAFSPSLIRPAPANDVENVRDMLIGITTTCTAILDHFDV